MAYYMKYYVHGAYRDTYNENGKPYGYAIAISHNELHEDGTPRAQPFGYELNSSVTPTPERAALEAITLAQRLAIKEYDNLPRDAGFHTHGGFFSGERFHPRDPFNDNNIFHGEGGFHSSIDGNFFNEDLTKYKRYHGTKDGFHLEIFSDSDYAINCINGGIDMWKRQDWRDSSGKEIANRDLMERLDHLHNELKNRGKLSLGYQVKYHFLSREKYREAEVKADEILRSRSKNYSGNDSPLQTDSPEVRLITLYEVEESVQDPVRYPDPYDNRSAQQLDSTPGSSIASTPASAAFSPGLSTPSSMTSSPAIRHTSQYARPGTAFQAGASTLDKTPVTISTSRQVYKKAKPKAMRPQNE